MMNRPLPILLLFLATAATALGYGREGHEAVAALAAQMLQPSTRQAVIRLLGNDDLASISTWADELKLAEKHQGPLAGNPEAAAVNAKFPANHLWHFADLPLGTAVYRDNDRFANPDDIVHAIGRCVAILEAAPGTRTELSKAEALKFLVHLVGDIHQPLHCGCGYYEVHGHQAVLVTDPAKAFGLQTDKGANLLRYGDSHFKELHAYWDDTLTERVARSSDYRKLVGVLKSRVNIEGWRTAGDYHQWAETWVVESVREARGAYAGIVYQEAETGKGGKLKFIHVRLPESDERDQLGRAADQLAKAGTRLAMLLNAVRWQ
jgi:hypothetical protein